MRSTMQDFPLTIGSLMKHGTTVHADSEVVTATADGSRSQTYAELGRRAARLANGLRSLGIDGDQRVATFQWNNAEHLEAYLAIPSMGAVLHTLNIRLFPDQLVYIANHAEDQIVIVDDSLVGLLAPHLPEMKTVQHVLVAGPDAASADLDSLRESGKDVSLYEDLLADQSDEFDWPEIDERSGRGDVLHERHHRQPEGRRLQPPLGLAALPDGQHRQHRRRQLPRPGAADRADVPRQCLGAGVRRADERCLVVHAGPVAPGRAAVPLHEREQADRLRCGPDGVERRPRLPRRAPRQEARVAAADPVRRLRRTGLAAAGPRGAARPAHPPGVGDDRDLSRGLGRPAPGRRRGRRPVDLPRQPGSGGLWGRGADRRRRRQRAALGRHSRR